MNLTLTAYPLNKYVKYSQNDIIQIYLDLATIPHSVMKKLHWSQKTFWKQWKLSQHNPKCENKI